MKKIKDIAFSTIAMALGGVAAMANAADVSTTTSVKATVREPSAFHATYHEVAPLPAGKLEQPMHFGIITVNGYRVLTGESISLTDKTGKRGVLFFRTDDGSNHLVANAPSVKVNNFVTGKGGSLFTGNIDLFAEVGQNLKAGKYVDELTLTMETQ